MNDGNMFEALYFPKFVHNENLMFQVHILKCLFLKNLALPKSVHSQVLNFEVSSPQCTFLKCQYLDGNLMFQVFMLKVCFEVLSFLPFSTSANTLAKIDFSCLYSSWFQGCSWCEASRVYLVIWFWRWLVRSRICFRHSLLKVLVICRRVWQRARWSL